MTIKVGIIGLGAIGERVLNKFLNHPMTEVVAACDTSIDRLHNINKKYNLQTYQDYKEMLNNDSINLVYLAVPPKYHHRIALDVIEAKKHLFCEKPLANSIIEAEEMTTAAENAHIVNALNFPMPYSNVFQKFKEKITNGEIDEVIRVDVQMQFTTWPRSWQQNDWIASREQGGFIREVGPHYIQMIQEVFGDLKNIQSFVDFPEDPSLCEQGFIARMELANGTPVLFNGLSNLGQKEHISFKVYGKKGTVDLINWSELFVSTGDFAPAIYPLQREEEIDLIGELIKAINGENAKLVSFREGYNVQRVLESLLGNA
ncbi:Gfo/Idh/MocA family protein [Bacillus sp. CGMCC 1.16607]|uniref:Gfo/Idh/MocA family protein n=1 Tax=Bacillus sp. CGMCC 1.16607 TaxID=3351842 RepID=UPI0036403A92